MAKPLCKAGARLAAREEKKAQKPLETDPQIYLGPGSILLLAAEPKGTPSTGGWGLSQASSSSAVGSIHRK